MTDNLATARRYIAALSEGAGPVEIAQFFTADAIQEEFPNRLLPHGATRDVAALKEARARGQSLLIDEDLQILGEMADGDRVAMELAWRGTIGVGAGPFQAGQQLRARFAIFLEFRDGRVARQRNYDCFDPW